jgi:hypothetical protein
MYIAAEILELSGAAARARRSRIINAEDVEVNTRVVISIVLRMIHFQ